MKKRSFRFRRMIRKLHEGIVKAPIEPTLMEENLRERDPGEWERIRASIKKRTEEEG